MSKQNDLFKVEREFTSLLAELFTRKRIRIKMPDLPQLALGSDSNQANRNDWKDWNRRLNAQRTYAVCALAESRNADPRELAKVADFLVEVMPPETRGRRSKDNFPITRAGGVGIDQR